MELKDDFKNNKLPLKNDSINPNFISEKILINDKNNNQEEVFDFYESFEKEQKKESEKDRDLGNDKKVLDFLAKASINKIMLINSLPRKKVIIENSNEENGSSIEKKLEEDLFPDDEGEEKSDENYITDLNPKDEIKNIKNKSIREINENIFHFISEENNKKINGYDVDKENIKKTNNLIRTCSYNDKDININENLSNKYILSFFYLTTEHLKEELLHDHSFYSDFSNSHNYIPKFSLQLNYDESNNNINTIQPFAPNNNFKNIEENQIQQLFYNNIQKKINFNSNNYNQRNKNYIFNNKIPNNNEMNNNNNFYPNIEDLLNFKEFLNYANKQVHLNLDINNNKFHTNTSQKNIMLPKKYFGNLKRSDICEEVINNNKKMSFKNDDIHLKDNIAQNTNNIDNINFTINLYNIDNNKKYINLKNKIDKIQNSKKAVQININQNEIKSQMNNISYKNYYDNFNSNNYTTKMFGRLGWICFHCNNFNFNTRKNCNRCYAIKTPKIMGQSFRENRKIRKKKKLDWICLNCKNINYSFRKICNRCDLEKKEDAPLIYCEHNQKINYNTIAILLNNFGKRQNCLTNNSVNNNNINNFINNNKNKNNYINYDDSVNVNNISYD